MRLVDAVKPESSGDLRHYGVVILRSRYVLTCAHAASRSQKKSRDWRGSS